MVICQRTKSENRQKQKSMPENKHVCIHGHFYQPPRENAWLEVVELQDSAAPFHDWNERINFECYAPNTAARVLDAEGLISKITNNYAQVSFNFGPTLLSWLQKADPETYREILAADLLSREHFSGHGNAIAQAYNHLIMPLANERDRETQVLWGIADFEHRFGRKPEGMWLPETAVDTQTLELLAQNGIRFTILAPRQAKAFRKTGDEAWTPLQETVEPRRPYRCNLSGGKSIALFFYDGNVAKDVAFNGLLSNGERFAKRMTGVFDDDRQPQLAHIATDGESYGHHHRFGEMALAHCLDYIEEQGLATVTNYGEFLEKYPPEYEVQIHDGSSWSCVHGVERWRSDCGCNTGGQPGWNQAWRSPLRETLDWLRDELLVLFEKEASPLAKNIRDARNDYIQLILDRSEVNVNRFIRRHAAKELTPKEKTSLLRQLEIQRHCMLMYTSCAWFFSEISGIETNQVMQYALRAICHARHETGLDLEPEFMQRLEKVPSNVLNNGAESFLKNVAPSELNLTRVGMHYAASSIFNDYERTDRFLHYTVKNEVFERIPAGFQQLAFGRVTLVSNLTYSEKNFSFAVLHFGQQNMFGSISLDMNRAEFDAKEREIAAAFRSSNIGDSINYIQTFGTKPFSFRHLFKDEKRKILQLIMERSLPPVDTVIRDYYEDNYQLMTGMLQSDIPVPEGWRNIAQYIINQDLHHFFANGRMNVKKLQQLAHEFARWNVSLTDIPTLSLAAGERIFAELKNVDAEKTSLEQVQSLPGIIEALEQLGVVPELWKSQNLYYQMTDGYRSGKWVYASQAWKEAFLKLGKLLNMRMDG
jgi:alpha-amylase/alpha-mannosidase (GH57 family)